MAFDRLIKFVAADGRCLFGEPRIASAEELHKLLENGSLEADVLDVVAEENVLNFDAARRTGEVVAVKELIGPLDPKHVPIIRCIGLNYIKHSKRVLVHQQPDVREVIVPIQVVD